MGELFWWLQRDNVKVLEKSKAKLFEKKMALKEKHDSAEENKKAKFLKKILEVENEIRAIDEKITELKSENKG